MNNIAITGISGYIGTRLFRHLDAMESVQRIVVIDVKKPKSESAKLIFYYHDILKPFGNLFVENEVDIAVHLAFILRPTRNRAFTRQIDVEGMMNFTQACKQANVKHILYLSSHTVYAAHYDNPIPITEDSPPRPLHDFQYSWDKAKAEQILRDFGASCGNITITILRSCPVIGPNAANSAPTLMFKPPVMIGVAGFDPPMQFVHEDDLIKLIEVFLTQKKGGIFNVAGDEGLTYGEVVKLVRKRMLRLPERLLKLLMLISWAMHLQNDSPPSGLEFIKYPPLVSTERLKKEIEFEFQYSTKEALSSFLSSVKTL
ncbi:MAG: NAD-dependent epimerase/dehydratase family protein [Desulfobacteraceae bacterium]|nr:NAD-dependent epimerase/dehydratase family protein [Desulfobacteraceae bacterium]